MWFFIPLGFRYGRTHPYFRISSIHGPYNSREEAHRAFSDEYRGQKEEKGLFIEGEVLSPITSMMEKPESEKWPADGERHYLEEGVWRCTDCHEPLMAVRVSHPVHLTEWPGAGFGEVKYTEAPYCPNCEIQPDSRGEPILQSLGPLADILSQ